MNPLDNLINEYTKALKPMKAFNDVMSYDQFVAPLQKFTETATNQYKPWYEYFQAAPAKQQLRSNAAASNANMTGFGKDTLQRGLREIYQPMTDAISGMQEQFRNQWIDPMYNQRIQQYYQNPLMGFDYNAIQGPQPAAPKPVANPYQARINNKTTLGYNFA